MARLDTIFSDEMSLEGVFPSRAAVGAYAARHEARHLHAYGDR
jgi:hypothetical protein